MKISSISLTVIGFYGTAAASLRGEIERDLATVLYYPRYTGDYNTAWCTSNNQYANNSPGYTTELACCKANFPSQTSGKCYSMLPSPPTASPIGVDGPDAYYRKPDVDFAKGYCVNTRPIPVGPKIYETELECCKAEYRTQISGVCLSYLPSPPTKSPIPLAGPDIWYKKPYIDWAKGYCINTHPAPIGATTYDSEFQCCKSAYAGQISGACLAQLPSPPTASPFGVDGPDAYYRKPDVDWAKGHCVNTHPVPVGAKIYETELKKTFQVLLLHPLLVLMLTFILYF